MWKRYLWVRIDSLCAGMCVGLVGLVWVDTKVEVEVTGTVVELPVQCGGSS